MDAEQKCYEPVQILSVLKQVNECTDTLRKIRSRQYKTDNKNFIKQARYQLLSIVKRLKLEDPYKPPICSKADMEREIFLVEVETEREETKISHLREEWSQQQKTMAKLQDNLNKKVRLLTIHSSYCSEQGSGLCSILATLMENFKLVESLLEQPDEYLIRLIKIADGCLFSFIKTYSLDATIEDTNDYRYVLALYTCIHLISKLENGRQFLVRQEDCQIMLSELISILPNMNHATIVTLKITLLKILYNLALDEEGIAFLKHCPELMPSLDDCIRKPYEPQIHKYLLEILDRATRNIGDKEYLDKIIETINMQRLRELSDRVYKEVNRIPKYIFKNIRKTAQSFILENHAQGDIPRDKSVGTPFMYNPDQHRCLPYRFWQDQLKYYASEPMTATSSVSDTSYSPVETPSSPRSQFDIDTSCSTCSSYYKKKTLKQRPIEGTIRPSTRRDIFVHSLYSPLKLRHSPFMHSFTPTDRNRLEITNIEPVDIISDKFETKGIEISETDTAIPPSPISESIETKIIDSSAFKMSPTTLSATVKKLTKNKNIQTFSTNSCINYINRKRKEGPFQQDVEIKSPNKKIKSVHSEYQYKRLATYCTSQMSSSFFRRRRSSFRLSSFVRQKSSTSYKAKKVSASNIMCVSVSTSCDNVSASKTRMISESELEKELRTCGLESKECSLVPWNPEERMLIRLSDFDKRVGHYVKNTVRITSRLHSNMVDKSQQRVITRIKIPGMSFTKWANSKIKYNSNNSYYSNNNNE